MNLFKKLHNDEEGIETIQVVMILAVAAIALALVKLNWQSISTWFKTSTEGQTKEWDKAAP